MAFKQPRVPEYRESEGTGKYLRSLVLFLKDFCMDVWTANRETSREISDKLDKTGTAADSSKLGGKTLAEIMLALYPVGAVYISANSTSPASLFGGTWEQLKDKFLLGAGGSYSAGSTGGEATHTLTIDETASHLHSIAWSNTGNPITGGNDAFNLNEPVVTKLTTTTEYGAYYHTNTKIVGGNQPHNNMPPYLAVYMWKRVS